MKNKKNWDQLINLILLMHSKGAKVNTNSSSINLLL